MKTAVCSNVSLSWFLSIYGDARDSEVESARSGGICERALGERMGEMAWSQMVI